LEQTLEHVEVKTLEEELVEIEFEEQDEGTLEEDEVAVVVFVVVDVVIDDVDFVESAVVDCIGVTTLLMFSQFESAGGFELGVETADVSPLFDVGTPLLLFFVIVGFVVFVVEADDVGVDAVAWPEHGLDERQ
jgi:hypothetical protein